MPYFLGFTSYERDQMTSQFTTTSALDDQVKDSWGKWMEQWQCLPDDESG